MRISDWSSDVCSSDLPARSERAAEHEAADLAGRRDAPRPDGALRLLHGTPAVGRTLHRHADGHRGRSHRWHGREPVRVVQGRDQDVDPVQRRSEEHTSELQSLMRISYAVFCLKKKKKNNKIMITNLQHIIHYYILKLTCLNTNK